MTNHESQSETVSIPAEMPMDELAMMRRVEAALFVSPDAVTSRKLAELAFLTDGTQARTVVGLLNQRYNDVGRSFQIKQVAGGYQMMTRPQFYDWLRRLEPTDEPFRLSIPAMETLAVVAYRQPILKAEIESIRGVNCGEMLRQLHEREMVKIVGRSDELGRPYFYGTTKRFLELFGLSRIESLPRAKELVGQGLPKTPSIQQNIDDPAAAENPASPSNTAQSQL